METTTLEISGMTCENCVRFVTEALENVFGVHSARVSLAEKSAVVEHNDADVEEMMAAVEEEGYQAQLAL